MVDWKFHIGKKQIRIRNFELFTIILLIILYVMAATIKEGTWLYETIASLSSNWKDTATNSEKILLMAFAFATFGNTTVLIVFPYALIVFEIAKIYPNWVLLGIVSGAGAAVGEITSYIVGRLIAKSKKIEETDLGEKFHRMRDRFERHPKRVPLTVFFFALTPLPDDMILVPMGMMKYPYWKSIIPCFLGKTGLCLLMAWLGHTIGENAEFLNQLGEAEGWSWLAPILKLFVPSQGIDPAADIIQFSLIFIFIYFMVRLDFEKGTIKRSDERRDFQQILLKGGNYKVIELINRFHIQNEERFMQFISQFVEKYDNVSLRDDIVHFEELLHKRDAFNQSMDLGRYIFDRLDENEYKFSKNDSISENKS